ncbi:autophagy protein atg9 [Podochytrium sp. JEL0797]|nr:autophagy protein atg9 [Podochytrium sp. JEL0797]
MQYESGSDDESVFPTFTTDAHVIALPPLGAANGQRGPSGFDSDGDSGQPPFDLLVEDASAAHRSSDSFGSDDFEDDKDKARRLFETTKDKDDLLTRIYLYFKEKGFVAIVLARMCHLIILAFMVAFSTFAFSCIDHSLLHTHKRLEDVIVPQCLSKLNGLHTFFLLLFSVWWIFQLVHFLVYSLPKLLETKLIFNHFLDIPERLMDTVTWPEIVSKLTTLNETPFLVPNPDPTHDRQDLIHLDAHSIVTRIMRKENYMIALFNKDVLNLKAPGLLGTWVFKGPAVVTKIVEWCLYLCVVLYAFDEQGQLRERFLKARFRRRLIVGLQKRFELVAFLSLLFSPFLLALTLLHFVFTTTESYQTSPSTAFSARTYTPHARWLLRDFNELPHTFEHRLNQSHPLAVSYLAQFRNQKVIVVARLVSLVCGSFVAALALLAVLDDQLLVEFEVSPGRSALFYVTVFGAIVAGARAMVPEETKVFEPERLMREVVEEIHYLPDGWKGKLHTEEVRNQFSVLFDLKIVQLLLEIISIPLTPYLLYSTLPLCAESIVDFFATYTVSMDHVGLICSYSAFDLARYGNPRYGVPTLHPRDEENEGGEVYSKQGKMEQSFLYFQAQYPQWEPGADGERYLEAVGRSVVGGGRMRGDASVLFDGGALGRSRRNVGVPSPLGMPSPLGVPSLQNGRGRGASRGGGESRFGDESRFGGSEMEGGEEVVGIVGILEGLYEASSRAGGRL